MFPVVTADDLPTRGREGKGVPSSTSLSPSTIPVEKGVTQVLGTFCYRSWKQTASATLAQIIPRRKDKMVPPGCVVTAITAVWSLRSLTSRGTVQRFKLSWRNFRF